MTGWKIPSFNRKYIFIRGRFYIVMFVFGSVNPQNSSWGQSILSIFQGPAVRFRDERGFEGYTLPELRASLPMKIPLAGCKDIAKLMKVGSGGNK